MNASLKEKKQNGALKLISGVVVGICVTLISILLFAVVIRFVGIDDKFIFPINQVIKVISLFVAMTIALKGNKEKGLYKGLIVGFAYYTLSFVVFAILQGKIAISMSNLYDLLLTTLMGGVVGLIVVHIGK